MYQITKYAKNADCIFLPQNTIQIHSIYKNTVNFTSNKALFSFQNETTAMTPFCFTVSNDKVEKMAFSIGEILWIENNKMLNDRISISVDHAQIWDAKINAEPSQSENVNLQKTVIRGVLEKREKKELGNIEKAQYAVLNKGIHAMRESFREKNYLEMAQSGADLIGLGGGLTPSGDDFNVGFLSVLHKNQENPIVYKILQCFIEELEKKSCGTNDISAEFIKYACIGQYSEIFHTFYNTNKEEKIRLAAQGILNLGHSSGADMLAGMYLALEFIHDLI